ncbi:retrovirus-related pol polyprotein from transposon TNT 1-94, partial [Tanacetum coccineum]
YKARLVAKGFTQKEGIDYDETFAPVAKLRTLLVVAIHHDWIIGQLDVNNAFVHRDLHEEVKWFEKLITFLKYLGFKQSYVDTSLFTLQTATTFLSLLVYVDDILEQSGLALTQRKYALNLVTYAGLLDNIPSATPLDLNKKLTPDNGAPLSDPSFYKALVGKLLYLTITRLDLSFAIHALSQFFQQPRAPHMKPFLRLSDMSSSPWVKASSFQL